MGCVGAERPRVPASNTSTLSLAGRLRDLGDPELTELLSLREVRDVRLRDFFDLADALLDPQSIERAITRLDRTTLAAIATVGDLATEATTETIGTRLAALSSEKDVVLLSLEA
ncbi:MAG: hypothetical protein JWR35_3660, partial [Marmoricola sp.]|nr:hypothetical protein [Marmoricola sp.]